MFDRPDDEEAEESTPWAEQQTWEALQIANASMKTGAKAGRKGGKQYDLVFADQIDFVTNEVLAGTTGSKSSGLGCWNCSGQYSCGS